MDERTERIGIAWDLFLLGASIFLFAFAGRYGAYAEGNGLGPDFWPRVVVALMAASALADLVLRAIALRRAVAVPAEGKPEAIKTERSLGPAIGGAMAALVAYVAALPYVGFFLTTLAFIPVILFLAAYRSIWILAIGAGGTIALTYLFQAWLGANFPIGQGPFERATIVIYHALHVF